MVYQFLSPLVETGLLVTAPDKVRFATSQPDCPERLTEFYTLALAARWQTRGRQSLSTPAQGGGNLRPDRRGGPYSDRRSLLTTPVFYRKEFER